jgi:hypothetical protein
MGAMSRSSLWQRSQKTRFGIELLRVSASEGCGRDVDDPVYINVIFDLQKGKLKIPRNAVMVRRYPLVRSARVNCMDLVYLSNFKHDALLT